MIQKDAATIKQTDQPLTAIDLRARERWLDLDSLLILFAGAVVLTLTGVFFSARRLATPDPTLTTATYGVNAAGVASAPISASDLSGTWLSDDALTFTFHEGGTVEISDEATGDLTMGAWEFSATRQTVTVSLGSATTLQTLTFAADRDLLILTTQTNTAVKLGTTLQKS